MYAFALRHKGDRRRTKAIKIMVNENEYRSIRLNAEQFRMGIVPYARNLICSGERTRDLNEFIQGLKEAVANIGNIKSLREKRLIMSDLYDAAIMITNVLHTLNSRRGKIEDLWIRLETMKKNMPRRRRVNM
jgi:hypothetical protein